MSFTDACLVRMAEMHPERALVASDDDFRVYRACDEPIDVHLLNG